VYIHTCVHSLQLLSESNIVSATQTQLANSDPGLWPRIYGFDRCQLLFDHQMASLFLNIMMLTVSYLVFTCGHAADQGWGQFSPVLILIVLEYTI